MASDEEFEFSKKKKAKKHFKGEFHKPMNLMMLAQSKQAYYSGGVEVPVLNLEKLHPKLLRTYLNRIVTVDFEGKLSTLIEKIVSHIVLSEPTEMKPDASEALYSDFTPLVRRRLASITNVIFLKPVTPISKILMVVDYFKGSAPERLEPKKAEKKLAEILMEHFTEKNPRRITGLLMEGPDNKFILVAFHMDYGEEESYGFKKTRTAYKDALDLSHEEGVHKI